MKIPKDIEEYVATVNNGSCIIGEYKYYFKKAIPPFIKTELIANKLAALLNIKCLEYISILIADLSYYFSKDLNAEGTFYTLSELGVLDSSLSAHLQGLNDIFPNNPELIDDIIKIYLFDILFMNSDRNPGNIGLLVSRKGPKIIMLDNEFIFDEYAIGLSVKHRACDISENSIYGYNCGIPEFLQTNLTDLEIFLETAKEEYCRLFWWMYETATPEVVGNIIRGVDKDNLNQFLKQYIENYKLIGMLKGRESNGQRILKNKRIKQLY